MRYVFAKNHHDKRTPQLMIISVNIIVKRYSLTHFAHPVNKHITFSAKKRNRTVLCQLTSLTASTAMGWTLRHQRPIRMAENGINATQSWQRMGFSDFDWRGIKSAPVMLSVDCSDGVTPVHCRPITTIIFANDDKRAILASIRQLIDPFIQFAVAIL